MDKRIILISLISILLISSCTSTNTGNIIKKSTHQNLYQAELKIEGMTCPSCAYGVKAQLEELDGVIKADIDYEKGKGTVIYDKSKISAEQIARASTVYPAQVISSKRI
jgi:copper chaperone CopZ